MIALLLALARIFAELSLLALGGGLTVLPEMQRQVVEVQGWLSAQDFSATFALAQAAPGPNLMVVTLIGWRVAGLPGAFVASLAMFAPPTVLTCLVVRIWQRLEDRPWRRLLQTSLVPLTAGLICAGAALLTAAFANSFALLAITAAAAIATTTTRVPPLLMLAIGALVGLTGFGQP